MFSGQHLNKLKLSKIKFKMFLFCFQVRLREDLPQRLQLQHRGLGPVQVCAEASDGRPKDLLKRQHPADDVASAVCQADLERRTRIRRLQSGKQRR